MSTYIAQRSLRLAESAETPAERLGHLHAAQDALKKAIKSALSEALEAAAGQESLPLTTARGGGL